MSRPIAYGIDFGTTNSSLSVAYPDRLEILELSQTGPMAGTMPSLGYVHRNGVRSAGGDAIELFLVGGSARTVCGRCSLVVDDGDGLWSDCKQYRHGGGCMDARLMAALKSELANDQFRSTHSWGRSFEVADLVALVLEHLRRRADQHTGEPVRRVVIGHPVAFVGTSGDDFDRLQKLAADRLTEAAFRAGFAEVELYPEPAAAVLDEELEDGHVLAVDFGGGTFDVVIIEVADGEGEVVALQGAPVGGTDFDAGIFKAKLTDLLGLNERYGRRRRPVPAWFRTRLQTMSGVKHLLADPLTPVVLSSMRPHRFGHDLIEGILFGGHAYAFYQAIEQAKIDLSTTDRTSIEFHRRGLDVSVPFTRMELDSLVFPFLDTVARQIRTALEQAGIGTGDVSMVLRTGGSSRLGAFVDMLEAMFGADRVREREAYTSVANGLGVVAQELWS